MVSRSIRPLTTLLATQCLLTSPFVLGQDYVADSVTTVDLTVHDTASTVDIDLEHDSTGQTFSLLSLSSNAGLYGGGIGLRNNTASFPFWVFDTARSETLSIREEGVAIGTYTGAAPLHVYADGYPIAEASVLIENDLSTVQTRQMLTMLNKGPMQFTMENTDLQVRWDFYTNSVGHFNISKHLTGGAEFAITPEGRFFTGPGNYKALDSRANGNLHIGGTLFETSDRQAKTQFESVDYDDVLDRLERLEISSWVYKHDDDASRHIGPVAQDFNALYDFGEGGTTIAVTDKVGVALAAIKALQGELKERDATIDALIQRIDALEDRIVD